MKILSNRSVNIIAACMAFISIFLFAISAYNDSAALRKQIRYEPPDYSYRFDGLSFLKSFYHMKEGMSFYDANSASIKTEGRRGAPPPFHVSGWRLPTVFYFWSNIAENGEHIWYMFLILTVTVLSVLFFTMMRVSSSVLALFALSILEQYFYAPLVSVQFLLVEWWGVLFFLFGIVSFFQKRYSFGVLLLLVAALVRELFLLPVIIGLIMAIHANNKQLLLRFISALVVFFGFYMWHYFQSFHALFTHWGVYLAFSGQRFGHGGILFLRKTLAYGTLFFVTNQYKIQLSLIMLITTMFGSVFIYKNVPFIIKYLMVILFMYIGLFVFVGTDDNDYWGIVYVPLLFVLFPIVLQQLISTIHTHIHND